MPEPVPHAFACPPTIPASSCPVKGDLAEQILHQHLQFWLIQVPMHAKGQRHILENREGPKAASEHHPHSCRHFSRSRSSISQTPAALNPNFSGIAGQQTTQHTKQGAFPEPEPPKITKVSPGFKCKSPRNTCRPYAWCKSVAQSIRSPMSANPDGVEADSEQQVGQNERDDAPHDVRCSATHRIGSLNRQSKARNPPTIAPN